jgi:hypothetical protein
MSADLGRHGWGDLDHMHSMCFPGTGVVSSFFAIVYISLRSCAIMYDYKSSRDFDTKKRNTAVGVLWDSNGHSILNSKLRALVFLALASDGVMVLTIVSILPPDSKLKERWCGNDGSMQYSSDLAVAQPYLASGAYRFNVVLTMPHVCLKTID